ncbi:glycosyltransferase [Candidatus Sumerlaeota bacterium]|nr:glycosyltransferase [Candidatus Sumerlaeota bacterium]
MINTLEVGGAEMRLAELARRLPPARFEVHVACMVGAGAYETAVRESGAQIHLLGYRGVREDGRLRLGRVLGLPFVANRVAGLVRRVRPDVFHTFLPNCNVFGAVAAALTGFPALVASRVFLGAYRSVNPLYPAIENWAARRARRIACNCEAVRRDVLERERVDPSRVRVVLNGIDAERFAPRTASDPQARRRELGLPTDGPLVGIVANFLPHKRHEDFLAAAGRVAVSFPQARFLLAGRPYDRQDELAALAERLGIAERVHFLGPRADMPDLYPLLDVAVSTSTNEGLSNALIEAQSCGVPVVATAIAGAAEIVGDGETGFLTPPRDDRATAEKIALLLGDETLRLRFAAEARRRVLERFSVDRMVADYAALYEEICKEVGRMKQEG